MDDDLLCGKKVTIHRVAIQKEVMKIFKDESILNCHLHITVIATAGREEEEEGKKVLLDVLACLWQNCFTSLIIGNNEKVPFTGLVMQKLQWEAIA